MGLNLTIGGAITTFDSLVGQEVAGVLDRAFGGETEWEVAESRGFGELSPEVWSCFRRRLAAECQADDAPNLLSISEDGRGVFLPTHVQSVALPLSWGTLRCGSLSGLRRELERLAAEWRLPEAESDLQSIVASEEAEDSQVVIARLILASNEAVRRGCPFWFVGVA